MNKRMLSLLLITSAMIRPDAICELTELIKKDICRELIVNIPSEDVAEFLQCSESDRNAIIHQKKLFDRLDFLNKKPDTLKTKTERAKIHLELLTAQLESAEKQLKIQNKYHLTDEETSKIQQGILTKIAQDLEQFIESRKN